MTENYLSPVVEDYPYARISDDEVGLEKGVTRQIAECRELSILRGGTIMGEYSDNDISVLDLAPRDGFDQLMEAVTAPNPDRNQRRIVVVHTSRLWRNRSERAAGIDILGRHRIAIMPVNGPYLDLSTAAGRMVAGMLGEVDTGESETKAERIRSSARERAMQGRANGPVHYGWQRMYEYTPAGKVAGFTDIENPVTAAIVREIIDRILGGESLNMITADLNERGVPAPKAGKPRRKIGLGQLPDGSLWSKSSVRKIAVRPANIGLRVYHRGQDDEMLVPAAWDRIVDPDKHDRVVALLEDPTRKGGKPGAREHLLTHGIGECGANECGGPLRVARRGNSRHGTKQRLYVCANYDHVGRNQQAVDMLVTATMVALLRRPDVLDLLAGEEGETARALSQVESIRARLAQAAADYADEAIDSAQLRIITAKLRPQLAAAESQAKAARRSPHLELVTSAVGDVAQQRWDGMSVTQRRAVMEAFRVRVVILPVTRRGPGFDPDSVLVVPRGGRS